MKIKNEALKRYLESGCDSLTDDMIMSLGDETEKPERPIEHAERQSQTPATLAFFGRLAHNSAFSVSCSIVLCAVLIVLLLQTVMDMPYFGAADTLIESEVSNFYLDHTLEDTGVVNVVSGIILSYRGFDTLGESHVLFIAVCSVFILLSFRPSGEGRPLPVYDYDDGAEEPHADDILKYGARVLAPMILVFGLYIIFNGNISPGGGFAGGAVLGAGLIYYLCVFGYRRMRRLFTIKTFRLATCMALISYSLMKGFHFITGANGIHVPLPLGEAYSIFSGGMLLPLNICVGITVACTMYALFTMFRKGDF